MKENTEPEFCPGVHKSASADLSAGSLRGVYDR